ncbi:Nuclear envelope phosphatase-regulatory subunit 1, partial [Trichinella sp. T6]
LFILLLVYFSEEYFLILKCENILIYIFKMHRVHLESDTCDDLKAFERRLMEIIACMQPAAKKWRAILAVVLSCLVVSSCLWLADPHLSEENLIDSLKRNTFFSASFVVMIILLLCGIHRRVVAPSIMAARCRSVLAEFNLSCDDNGKLKLKIHPYSP